MPIASVNGVDLYYETVGEGPPIVFIHGMCGNADVWAGQVDRLSDSFTCVTYDRRGHTRSTDSTQRHSVQLHSDDFAALVRSLILGQVLLVGSSRKGHRSTTRCRELRHRCRNIL